MRNVNFSNSNNQKALEDIDIGFEAKAFLNQQVGDNKIGKEQINEFFRNYLKFYITASNEIRNRLPFDDLFLSYVFVFRPQVAFYADRKETFARVRKTCETLGSYVETELSKEWQSLLELSPEIKGKWPKLSFDDMWSAIAVFCTEAQVRMFLNDFFFEDWCSFSSLWIRPTGDVT